MISWIRDYTIQTIFVALQSTVIVYGILITATLLKGNGYPEYENFFWFSKFVRHAGFLFLLVPAGWVWLTCWYDQSSRNYPLAFTVATGIGLLFILYQIFAASAAGTYRKTFISEDPTALHAPYATPADHVEGGKASPSPATGRPASKPKTLFQVQSFTS